MKKIKLISDSTCDLSQELIQKHNIEIIPLTVSINDVDYKDLIELNTEAMYDLVDEFNVFPKTSAVSPGEFEQVFLKYLDEDFDIVYLGVGSKFSATFQSATLAKNNISSERIHLIDSMNLSSGIAVLLLKAASFIESGEDVLTVVSKLQDIVPKVRSQLVIDSLEYLHKGGRLSTISAFIGKVIRIHPVVHVRNGEMKVSKNAIGSMKKGLTILINQMLEHKEKIDDEFIVLTHSFAMTHRYLEKKVKDNFQVKNLYETHAGCVISAHGGKGSIGLAYILNDK